MQLTLRSPGRMPENTGSELVPDVLDPNVHESVAHQFNDMAQQKEAEANGIDLF